MALMVTEVYDALRAANVPEPQARKAAEAMAGYEPLRAELRLHRWMLAFNLAISTAILLKLLA